jgi:hypothetical protein
MLRELQFWSGTILVVAPWGVIPYAMLEWGWTLWPAVFLGTVIFIIGYSLFAASFDSSPKKKRNGEPSM